jgi:prepilin-type N-terminal cleavage/methylation domain-containing protein/prepilin-type processing-associated H-X9-DG protein
MICRSIKGFTLVELLVVISILGVLAAALTTQVTNAREAARAMKCKTNLKNLAQAALAYAVDDHAKKEGDWKPSGTLPWAGSHEGAWTGGESVGYRPVYHHNPGWVSWTWSGGKSLWEGSPTTPQSGGTRSACFHGDVDVTFHSLSNGVLWNYVGADLASYVCETHRDVCKRKGVHSYKKPIRRSYVMNSYFGFDYRGKGATLAVGRSIKVDSLSSRGNAGALLMFAELPAFKLEGSRFVESIDAGDSASDGVLQTQLAKYYYDDGQDKWITIKPSEEIIGFNHKVAKRHVAHVAFADGHVDGVVAPEKPTITLLNDLTCLLCNGVDLPADPGEWASAKNDHVK